MSISFKCSGCGKPFKVKDDMAGKRVRCTACKTEMTIPGPGGAVAAAPARPAPRNPEAPRARPPAAAPAPAATGGLKPCPKCNANCAPTAIICLQCGFNFRTGQATEVGYASTSTGGLLTGKNIAAFAAMVLVLGGAIGGGAWYLLNQSTPATPTNPAPTVAPPPTAMGPSASTPTRTAASSHPGLGWTDPWIFRWPSTPEPFAPEAQAPALPFVPLDAPMIAAPPTPLPAQPLPPLPEGMRQIDGVPSGVLAADPRGGTVVIGSTAGVQVWDLEAGHMVRTLEAVAAPAVHIVCTSDGSVLALLSDQTFVRWNLGTGKLIDRGMIPMPPGTLIAFAPDGRRAVIGGPTLMLVDTTRLGVAGAGNPMDPGMPPGVVPGMNNVMPLPIQARNLRAMFLLPGGKHLLACSGDNGTQVQLWDLSNNATVRQFAVGDAIASNISVFDVGTNSRSLAAGDPTGSAPVRVWDFFTGRQIAEFDTAAQQLALSKAGDYLLTWAPGQELIVWQVRPRKEIARIATGQVEHLAFIPGRPEFIVHGNGVIRVGMLDVQMSDDPAPASAPKPAAPESPQEKPASRDLELAKMYLGVGDKDRAGPMFEAIVKRYPDTQAAAEAKTVLEQLKAEGWTPPAQEPSP